MPSSALSWKCTLRSSLDSSIAASPLSARIAGAFYPPYFVSPKFITQAEMDVRMDAGLDTFALNLIPFYIINWSQVNYYLRYLCLAVPAFILLRCLLHLYRIPWMPAKKKRGLMPPRNFTAAE